VDFSSHPSGIDFVLFGQAHLVAVAIVLGINLSVIWLRDSFGEKAREWFRIVLAVFILATEISYQGWRGCVGIYTLRDSLPFHLCAVMSLVAPLMLLTRNQVLYELVYFLGIGGATQAIVTPDVGAYGYPHWRFFASFMAHGGIVTAAIYMTVVERRRPSWSSIVRVGGVMLAYMAVIEVVNFQIGSNYLFIARKPDFPTLIDHLGPWPWYILSLIGVGLVSCFVLHLPFLIRDRLRASRAANG
jgi:hypothetical integral membrane protein (TIGR02206 family)